MTRELELREQVANDLQVTEEVLNHLLVHLRIKLQVDTAREITILRLLKYNVGGYVRHLADNFLTELNK